MKSTNKNYAAAKKLAKQLTEETGLRRKKRPRPKFPEIGDLQIGRQPSAATPMNPAGLNSMNLVPKKKKKKRR